MSMIFHLITRRLCLVLIFLVPLSLAAQNVRLSSGNAHDFYYDNGNVGIGVGMDSPSGNLQLDGLAQRMLFSTTTSQQTASARIEFWEAHDGMDNPDNAHFAMQYDGSLDAFRFKGKVDASNLDKDIMIMRRNGNVGIGNIAPQATLDVTGNIVLRNPEKNSGIILSPSNAGYGVDPEFVIQCAETGAGTGSPFHISRNATFRTSDDSYQYIDDGGENAASMLFAGNDITFRSAPYGTGEISWTNNLYVDGGTGQVGVGTISIPDEYTMAVSGKLIAEEVTVQLSEDWPDYVFAEGYDLPSLKETADYISENHHLPEIPSAAEVAENGAQLGEMNKLLLKKVEELTLHLIDLSEKEERREKRESALIKRIEELERNQR